MTGSSRLFQLVSRLLVRCRSDVLLWRTIVSLFVAVATGLGIHQLVHSRILLYSTTTTSANTSIPIYRVTNSTLERMRIVRTSLRNLLSDGSLIALRCPGTEIYLRILGPSHSYYLLSKIAAMRNRENTAFVNYGSNRSLL